MDAETRTWNIADKLQTDEDVAGFINAVVSLDDPVTLQAAIGEVARMWGMKAVADGAGVNEKSLYRALSDGGNPRISTLNGVLGELGLELRVQPKHIPAEA